MVSQEKKNSSSSVEDDVGNDASSKSSGTVSDTIRKVFTSGLGLLFMTEEGIRKTLNDIPLPKDALSYIVQQGEKTRHELSGMVKDEMRGFLKDINLSGEVRQVLKGLQFEIKATVRINEENEVDSTVKMATSRPDTKSTPEDK